MAGDPANQHPKPPQTVGTPQNIGTLSGSRQNPPATFATIWRGDVVRSITSCHGKPKAINNYHLNSFEALQWFWHFEDGYWVDDRVYHMNDTKSHVNLPIQTCPRHSETILTGRPALDVAAASDVRVRQLLFCPRFCRAGGKTRLLGANSDASGVALAVPELFTMPEHSQPADNWNTSPYMFRDRLENNIQHSHRHSFLDGISSLRPSNLLNDVRGKTPTRNCQHFFQMASPFGATRHKRSRLPLRTSLSRHPENCSCKRHRFSKENYGCTKYVNDNVTIFYIYNHTIWRYLKIGVPQNGRCLIEIPIKMI
jgi:hypothetical protein